MYQRNDETIGGLIERFIEEVHPMRHFGQSKLATLQLTARELNDVKSLGLRLEMSLPMGDNDER